MLYVDLPSRSDVAALAGTRSDACVSIYLETTPLTQQIEASRIELGNLLREAQRQLTEAGFDKKRLGAFLDQLSVIQDDAEFWRFQANSLAIFATPDSVRAYRLANKLVSMVQVSDRFHLKPLFRAVTFPHSTYVLALSENAVRLVQVHADLPAETVKVPALPTDAASAVGRSKFDPPTVNWRIQGPDEQDVRYQQYARHVDAALRPVLAGGETPLVLAASGKLAHIFPQMNTYAHLLPEVINENPDRLSEGELAERARPLLDNAYAAEIAEIRALYDRRAGDRQTTTDISDAARAATYGAIQLLLVDIDAVIPGFVDDETGAVTFAEENDAKSYGVVDEIMARAFGTGARILAVRRDDIPGGRELAAILRYPL